MYVCLCVRVRVCTYISTYMHIKNSEDRAYAYLI